MSGLLGLILKALFGGVADWLNHLRDVKEAEQKGAAEAALRQRETDDVRIQAAARARDGVDPIDRHVQDDPDFRD